MNWEKCISQAKWELGYSQNEWIYDWDEVIKKAKEIYWNNNTFKNLKEKTIEEANRKCKLCNNIWDLTAHHIYYGRDEKTICLCNHCHKIVHEIQNKRGFIMQLLLDNWDQYNKIQEDYPNLKDSIIKCYCELDDKISGWEYIKNQIDLEKDNEGGTNGKKIND